jgi:hypothetical protein
MIKFDIKLLVGKEKDNNFDIVIVITLDYSGKSHIQEI